MTAAPRERTMRPYHFAVRYGADLYTGFLYPDSGRFSLDCNGSFVGTGHYYAGGEVHGLGGRHRAAAAAIAAALAEHDPDLRALRRGAADEDASRRQGA